MIFCVGQFEITCTKKLSIYTNSMYQLDIALVIGDVLVMTCCNVKN